MNDNEILEELIYYRDLFGTMRERMERLIKRVGGSVPPPSNVEYDRKRLDEPPRAVQPQENGKPLCNCGLPAEFKKSAPQNPKQWAAYFCARPKNDPKNCGFRKWID